VKYVRSTEAGEGPHTLGLLSLLMAMASMAIKVRGRRGLQYTHTSNTMQRLLCSHLN
jgi:hypothetical protein